MGVALVQVASAPSGGTLTLPNPATLGNLLVVVIGHKIGGGASAGPTSTHGTWQLARFDEHASGNETIEIWYCWNIASTSQTITVPSVLMNSFVQEYSGITSAFNPFDRTISQEGSGNTVSTGTTITTASPHEVWVAGMLFSNATRVFSAPTNGFVIQNQLAVNNTSASLDRIVTTVGTASTSATVSGGAGRWVGAVATFRGFNLQSAIGTSGATSGHTALARHRESAASTVVAAVSVVGTVTRIRRAQAVAFGSSAVSGTAVRVTDAASVSSAVSTVTGTVRRIRRIASVVAATSTVTVNALRVNPAASSVSAVSAVTGTALRTKKATSAVACVSAVQVNPHVTRNVLSVVACVSGHVADAEVVTSKLVLLYIENNTVEESGGAGITLVGTFPVGTPFKVYIGLTGTSADPEAYSGVPGQGYTIYSKRSDRVTVYTPNLPPGTYRVHIESAEDGATLIIGVIVRPKLFRSSVFALRNVLPNFWKVGPRQLGGEA